MISDMRLLSYNIHGCVGRRGIVDPGAILDVIREADADVVALQEVHCEDALDRGFLRALERELDYPTVLLGPTMRKADADYGNVLLSRKPPLEEERIDLTFPHREPRGAIRATFGWDGRTLEITATHLGLLPSERRAQLRRLIEAPRNETSAIQVLMGDLNEWFPFGRAGRTLRNRFGRVKTVPTFPSRFPMFALDRVHARPNDRVRVNKRTLDSVLARTASDHLPLVAELEFL